MAIKIDITALQIFYFALRLKILHCNFYNSLLIIYGMFCGIFVVLNAENFYLVYVFCQLPVPMN